MTHFVLKTIDVMMVKASLLIVVLKISHGLMRSAENKDKCFILN